MNRSQSRSPSVMSTSTDSSQSRSASVMSTSTDRSQSRSPSVGPMDVQVDLPEGHHADLPVIYRSLDHPLHLGSGKAYYFIHDGTFEGAQAAYRLEVEELKIPQGPHEEAIELGFLELFPGDIIFSRLASDPVSGENDVPVLWVTGGDLYDEETKAAALRARDCALGLRSQRTRSHAKPDPFNTKIKVGGTAWERSLAGKFDDKRGRCYPFGCTFQRQRSLYSPCAAGKVSVTGKETLKMRNDLTRVTLDMAMLSLEQGPPSIVEAIKVNHNLVNTPCVGTHNNYGFTANQLNLAHVREWESSESLADNMGMKFGAAHIDQLDSPGHFTNMVALSDLPQGCDPGRFFIVYPGVFCTLHNFVSVNFSGLRVHGGSPPIAAPDATEYENRWATRCTIVSYAKTGPTSTEHKMPLMQLEPNLILSITPEMLRPSPFALDKKSKVDATNFIVEGPTIMPSSAIVEFLTRCFLMLVLTMLSQLPSKLDLKVDSDAFLGLFYYTDEEGVPHRVEPWYDGPGWRNPWTARNRDSLDIEETFESLEDQSDHIHSQQSRWTHHQNKVGAHIPSVLCCVADITPLEGWAVGDPVHKIKPFLFRKGKDKERDANSEDDDEASGSLPKTKDNANGLARKTNSHSKPPRPAPDAPASPLPSGNSNSSISPDAHDTSPPLASPVPSHQHLSSQNRDLGNFNPFLPTTHNTSPRLTSLQPHFSVLTPGLSPGSFPSPDVGFAGFQVNMNDSASALGGDFALLENQDWPRPSSRASVLSLSALFPQAGQEIQTPVQTNQISLSQLGKRTRFEANHDGHRTDEIQSAKRQATGRGGFIDSLWNHGSYQKLEIHLTTCTPVLRQADPGSPNTYANTTELERPTVDSQLQKEVIGLRSLPKYLRRITSERVQQEVDKLHDDVVSLATYQQPFDMADMVDNLTYFQTHLSMDPMDDKSFMAVQNVFASLDSLHHLQTLNAIRLRKLRACIMLSNGAAWNWLLVKIPKAITDIAHGRCHAQNDSAWLESLMMDIHDVVTDEDENVQFLASDYGLTLQAAVPAEIDLTRYRMPVEGDEQSWVDLYCGVVSEVIEVWLRYPSAGKLRWQGIYVLNIVQTLGPEFLSLDLVWEDYCTVTARTVQFTALPEHLDALEYPLLNATSELRQNVAHVSRLVDDYMAGQVYLPNMSSTEAAPTLSYASEHLRSIMEQRLQIFGRFVLNSFKHVILHEHLQNQKLQKQLDKNPDKYSLFRERAPTRTNMRQRDGPFSPAMLQTIPGVFSAIVARAITFGTKFSRLGRTVFTSPDDFEDALDECPQISSVQDYCDQAAYGRVNHKKKPELVHLYWERVHEHPWPGLTASSPLSFEDAYKYFHPNGTSRFTQLGKLGSYLLTVDYVYAGMVLPPNLETLGALIFKFNKGPVKALEYLGIIPTISKEDNHIKLTPDQREMRKKNVIEGFIALDSFIKDTIPAEYHKAAGVDMFLTEHAMCKFSRLYKFCDLQKA